MKGVERDVTGREEILRVGKGVNSGHASAYKVGSKGLFTKAIGCVACRVVGSQS